MIIFQNFKQNIFTYEKTTSYNAVKIISDHNLQIYKTLQLFTRLFTKYTNTNYWTKLLKISSLVA